MRFLIVNLLRIFPDKNWRYSVTKHIDEGNVTEEICECKHNKNQSCCSPHPRILIEIATSVDVSDLVDIHQ